MLLLCNTARILSKDCFHATRAIDGAPSSLYRLLKLFFFLLFPNRWLVFSLVIASWKNEKRSTVYRWKYVVVSFSLNLLRCPKLLLTFMPGICYMLTWFFSRGKTNWPCSFACTARYCKRVAAFLEKYIFKTYSPN